VTRSQAVLDAVCQEACLREGEIGGVDIVCVGLGLFLGALDRLVERVSPSKGDALFVAMHPSGGLIIEL
jgi:hypothetical protein